MAIPSNITTYKNQDVVHSFKEMYNVDDTEAQLLFQETKKWLWICATAKIAREAGNKNVPNGFAIVPPLIILDEMWHTFILYTADYSNFCNKYLGTFVNHRPAGKKPHSYSKEEIAEQISYIYDNLDEATVVLWFETYAERYSLDQLDVLRK